MKYLVYKISTNGLKEKNDLPQSYSETAWVKEQQAVNSSCITAWAASFSPTKQHWHFFPVTITAQLSSAKNNLFWVYVWNQNTVMNPMAGPYLWHPVKDSPLGIQPAPVSRSQWSRWFLLPCHEFCSCCCVYIWYMSQLIISLLNTPPLFPLSHLLLCSSFCFFKCIFMQYLNEIF